MEIKKLLLNFDKQTGEIKNSFIASKKGIYMFEFDNSYSWFNGKTIRYDYAVLTPLEIMEEESPVWLDYLYEYVDFVETEEEKN